MLESTLIELQTFIKYNDISKINTPVGISFTVFGNILVKYSLDAGLVFTGDNALEKAKNHLDYWLNENK